MSLQNRMPGLSSTCSFVTPQNRVRGHHRVKGPIQSLFQRFRPCATGRSRTARPLGGHGRAARSLRGGAGLSCSNAVPVGKTVIVGFRGIQGAYIGVPPPDPTKAKPTLRRPSRLHARKAVRVQPPGRSRLACPTARLETGGLHDSTSRHGLHSKHRMQGLLHKPIMRERVPDQIIQMDAF